MEDKHWTLPHGLTSWTLPTETCRLEVTSWNLHLGRYPVENKLFKVPLGNYPL